MGRLTLTCICLSCLLVVARGFPQEQERKRLNSPYLVRGRHLFCSQCAATAPDASQLENVPEEVKKAHVVQLKMVYRVLDLDGDGKLTRNEVLSANRLLYYMVAAKAEVDGDKGLTLKEFTEGFPAVDFL